MPYVRSYTLVNTKGGRVGIYLFKVQLANLPAQPKRSLIVLRKIAPD